MFQTSLYNELFFKPYLPYRNNRRKVDRSDDNELVSCRFGPVLPWFTRQTFFEIISSLFFRQVILESYGFSDDFASEEICDGFFFQGKVDAATKRL